MFAQSQARSRTRLAIAWILQALAAAVFLAAGAAKLVGAEQMVALFQQIGFGQWFRILTGFVEVGGAILLVVPRTAVIGAALLAATMSGAVLTHLFLIGGSPVPALVLLAVTLTVAWLRRDQIHPTLRRLGARRPPAIGRAEPS